MLISQLVDVPNVGYPKKPHSFSKMSLSFNWREKRYAK